jgi:hypothetical protein
MKKIKVYAIYKGDSDIREEVKRIEELFEDQGYEKSDFVVVWSEEE